MAEAKECQDQISTVTSPEKASTDKNLEQGPPSSPAPKGPGESAPTAEPYSIDSEAAAASHSSENILLRLLRAIDGLKQPSEITSHYVVPEAIRSVDEYEEGYPRLAAFQDCDPNFLVYRRFGYLHNRVLLHLQEEITMLEADLRILDNWEATSANSRKVWSHRTDTLKPDSKRQQLLKKIREKLKEFDEWLFRLQKIHGMKRPSRRNQNSVYQAVTSNVAPGETEWVLETDDLVSLGHDPEHNWFNVSLETMLNKLSPNLVLKIFRNKEQKIKTGSMPYLSLVSAKRFDTLLRGLLAILASLLILAPTFILFKLQPDNRAQVKSRSYKQMAVILVFTVTFSICCYLFTHARKQDVFTATAAYSAVLVVFLGNTSQVKALSNAT